MTGPTGDKLPLPNGWKFCRDCNNTYHWRDVGSHVHPMVVLRKMFTLRKEDR